MNIYLKLKIRKWSFGEVSLLINDYTDINKEIIIDIAKSIKRLNIITNHIGKCKKIEEYLYNEFGIMLNVSNNRKKSLLKAEIIININEKIEIKSKRFNGININYYKIQIPDKYILKEFQNEMIYESLIYGKNYININKMISRDEIIISKLLGNNGIIKEREFI